MDASTPSLCHRLAVRSTEARTAALRELAALAPDARRALVASEGRFAGWQAGVLAARAFVDAKVWPQALFRSVVTDFTPQELSAPGPDGVPVGFWFWLGSLKRAVSDKTHLYAEQHYQFRQTLAAHWGEEPMAAVVRTVLASPLAQGAGNLPGLIRKAHRHEQDHRLRRIAGADVGLIPVVLADLDELMKLPDADFLKSNHPLLGVRPRSIANALSLKPGFWFEDASRHAFWWGFINRQHAFSDVASARALSALIHAGFTPSPDEAALTRKRWLGVSPELDATLETMVLTDLLPESGSAAPTPRSRLRL